MKAAILSFIARSLARPPRPKALSFGRRLGRLLYRILGRKRKQALTALADAFPEWTEEQVASTARRVFEHTTESMVELLRGIGHPDENPVQFVVDDDPAAAKLAEGRARGKGLLVLTAHVGNFDLLAMWGASRFPAHVSVIVKEIRDPDVNAMITRIRRSGGVELLPARNSYRSALRCLRRNEIVGFIADQNMTREEGIFVEFFGKPACTSPGLAMLAAQTGAPVQPMFLVRDGDRHRVVFRDLIEPPADRSPEAIHAATQAYTRVIEEVVREYPDQWIWMHNRWRTRQVDGAAEGKRHQKVRKDRVNG